MSENIAINFNCTRWSFFFLLFFVFLISVIIYLKFLIRPFSFVLSDRSDFGCDGGNPYSGYTYVELTGGLMKETAYPYTSEDGKDAECASVKSDYKVTVTDYFFLDTEDEMIDYVTTTGPLSICIAAEVM